MLKKRIFIVLMILLLLLTTGCQKVNTRTGSSKEKEEKSLEEYMSNDEEITFKIYNQGNFPKHKLIQIKEEVLMSYDQLKNLMTTHYERPENINIYLFPGTGRSMATRNDISLYDLDTSTHSLVHEMTHILYGMGDTKSPYQYGALTQEGLAVYTQNEFGNITSPNGDLNVHELIKYFFEVEKLIPLYKLVNPEEAKLIVYSSTRSEDEPTRIWMAYAQAGSFVTYLIDEYGIEKFSEIYDHPDLESQIKKIYNMDLDELEKRWLDYVNINFNVPSSARLNNYLEYFVNRIDNIDGGLFKDNR
ncbi:hypothetical protein [Cytobacillus purgationiresistens]|uniref:Outer membrane lipoprotein-sorting protein n=1 Tax=Cytobacillus purgationiresistens TaxID=863449 RepID=A0ABU0AKZ7_9BACI|nr:hypothetical protein [Cytobacillus purgationiresistens]MDQ0271944.1 outer membrane lipoprotein-sorting protein [Cytobacillus purgationiresistens]